MKCCPIRYQTLLDRRRGCEFLVRDFYQFEFYALMYSSPGYQLLTSDCQAASD